MGWKKRGVESKGIGKWNLGAGKRTYRSDGDSRLWKKGQGMC